MRCVLPFLLLIGLVYGRPLQVQVSAESAILMNLKTGAILYDKEIHKPLSPASITKIATALYTLEKTRGAIEEKVIAAKEPLKVVSATWKRQHLEGMEYVLEHDGTKMGVLPGEEVSIRDLLYGLMLVSGNDAANVLAYHLSGSVPQFVEELNGFLKEKGIVDTHFCNPHGLYFPGHVTTAYDMAKITQMACAYPAFRDIVKTVRYTCPPSNKRAQPATFVQFNKLLKPGKFFYPKAFGVKTGYIAHARHTFVGAASDQDRELVVVLLGCPSSDARFQDAISLFKAAFAETEIKRNLFVKEDILFFCPIQGKSFALGAYLKDDIAISYFPAEEPEFKVILEWLELVPPIRKGDRIGGLKLLLSDGSLYTTAPLYAAHGVEKTFSDNVQRGWVLWKYLFSSTRTRLYMVIIAWFSLCYFLYKRLSKKRLLDRNSK